MSVPSYYARLPHTTQLRVDGWEVADVAPFADPGAGVYLTLHGIDGQLRVPLGLKHARELAQLLLDTAVKSELLKGQAEQEKPGDAV